MTVETQATVAPCQNPPSRGLQPARQVAQVSPLADFIPPVAQRVTKLKTNRCVAYFVHARNAVRISARS